MFQKDLLQGKRILITGGGTGLGKATAQRFLELGAEVYICGRRHEVLAAAEQELRERTRGKTLAELDRAGQQAQDARVMAVVFSAIIGGMVLTILVAWLVFF